MSSALAGGFFTTERAGGFFTTERAAKPSTRSGFSLQNPFLQIGGGVAVRGAEPRNGIPPAWTVSLPTHTSPSSSAGLGEQGGRKEAGDGDRGQGL